MTHLEKFLNDDLFLHSVISSNNCLLQYKLIGVHYKVFKPIVRSKYCLYFRKRTYFAYYITLSVVHFNVGCVVSH